MHRVPQYYFGRVYTKYFIDIYCCNLYSCAGRSWLPNSAFFPLITLVFNTLSVCIDGIEVKIKNVKNEMG